MYWSDGLVDTTYGGLGGGGVSRGELGEGTTVDYIMSTLQRGTVKLSLGSDPSTTGIEV